MTRPRQAPSLTERVAEVVRRVRQLENGKRDVISPISTAAATINQTAAQTPYMALVNPTGATMTWWVLVSPVDGTLTSLQLRAADGAAGDVVQAPSSGSNIVGVSLVSSPSWQPGTQILIYLDAWINVNSATVVPVSARFN